MAEDIFLPGKFTDLTNPHQLAVLNDLIYEMLGRLNQIDTGSIVLAWIQGAAAGQVIASKGVGNSPEWDSTVDLTGLNLSGLTASLPVVTNGSKDLASLAYTGSTSLRKNLGLETTDSPSFVTATGTTSLVAGSGGNTVTANATGITLAGTATVWDDLRVIPSPFDFPGVSDPVIGDWQPGGSGRTFKVWAFDQGDVGFFTVQLPHSYKQGTDIYVHVHWTPRTRGNEEGTATVAWKLDYSWANIDGTFGASATADMTDACKSSDHQHLMSPEATIDGHTAAKNISSMLMCAIYRDTGDTWSGTGATNGPALLEVDFHFEMDTLGSNLQSEK